MIEKRIKINLEMKLAEWIESITDDNLKKLVKDKCIITGGVIPSLLTDEPVNDYDIYFVDKETTLAVARYYVYMFNTNEKYTNRFNYRHKALLIDGARDVYKQIGEQGERGWKSAMLTNITPDRVKIIIRSDGVADLEEESLPYQEAVDDGDDMASEELEKLDKDKSKYRIVYMSTNAITLSDKTQIVIRFYGSPEEIHENFDFIHCTCSYTSWDRKLHLPSDALTSVLTKELKYRGSKYPLCSIIRTRKYLKRGWRINAGQYLKMALQLSELNLTDPAVLEDQLVGVDTMYFIGLIEELKAQKA